MRSGRRTIPCRLPVIASTLAEKKLLLAQKPVKHVVDLARHADVTFVGVGHLGEGAPLLQDGFVTRDDCGRCSRPAPSARSSAGPSTARAA